MGKALDKPFGEVIFSTGETIIAQCYKEAVPNTNQALSIVQGSVIRVESSYDTSYITYGLVAKINNTSLDSIHKPSALGLSSKELEMLQPQVYDLLRKELEIYLFANKNKEGPLLNHSPTKPMMIHDFIYQTTDKEVLELTNDFSNLINVIKKYQLKPDLLIDLINRCHKLRDCNYNYLVKIGQMLTLAFSDEIESLMPVLKRLSQYNM